MVVEEQVVLEQPLVRLMEVQVVLGVLVIIMITKLASIRLMLAAEAVEAAVILPGPLVPVELVVLAEVALAHLILHLDMVQHIQDLVEVVLLLDLITQIPMAVTVGLVL